MHQSIGRHIVVLHDCFCGIFFFFGGQLLWYSTTPTYPPTPTNAITTFIFPCTASIYIKSTIARNTHTNISSLLFFLGGSSFSILIRLDYFIPNRNLRYQHPLILRSTFTPQIHSFFHIANLFPDFLSTYMFLISSFLRPRSIENPSAFVFSSLSSF